MQKTRMCTSPSAVILGADQACHLDSVCTLKAASQAPPVAGDLSKLFVTLYYDLTIINYAVRCTASSNQLSSSAPIRSAWIYFRQNLALSATLEVPTICAFVFYYIDTCSESRVWGACWLMAHFLAGWHLSVWGRFQGQFQIDLCKGSVENNIKTAVACQISNKAWIFTHSMMISLNAPRGERGVDQDITSCGIAETNQ